MTTATIQKQVPAAALQFRAGELEFAEVTGDAKVFPFVMKARSPDVIQHPYWGRIVHDMAGMTLRKPTCPIDYCHWSDQIIGVGETFTADNSGLTVSGRLVALSADSEDRAFEVGTKAKLGVPYEASIDFRGPGVVLEELGEGASAEVNGQQLTGPLTIVRKWPLRSVAVAPYGADSGTSTAFSEPKDGELFAVSLLQEEKQMADLTPPKQETSGVSLDTLKQFSDAFGDKANGYLLSGLSYDQAELKFKDEKLSILEAENKTLKDRSAAAEAAAAKLADEQKQLAEKLLGEKTPVDTPGTGSETKKTFSDMFRVPKRT